MEEKKSQKIKHKEEINFNNNKKITGEKNVLFYFI